MVTQGSAHSALSRIEDSYCVGDVIIASTAVIGSGVVLRAEPGCCITIRDGVCLGSGVTLHATEGSLEVHQGVCIAGGVLIVGQGSLGQNTCVGAGSTLINPRFSDDSIISANSLWGDESRPAENVADSSGSEKEVEVSSADCSVPEEKLQSASQEMTPDPWEQNVNAGNHSSPPSQAKAEQEFISAEKSSVPAHVSKQVIGIQQFEMMVQKMFPDREAFRKAQQRNELDS